MVIYWGERSSERLLIKASEILGSREVIHRRKINAAPLKIIHSLRLEIYWGHES